MTQRRQRGGASDLCDGGALGQERITGGDHLGQFFRAAI